MKKLILFLMLFFLMIPLEAKGNTIRIHYHRFDENYEEWNLWLWPYEPVGGEGQAYYFDSVDDFGPYIELDLNETNMATSTSIGVIVRTDAWAKDVASDRFITLDDDGDMDIYLVQATEEIFYSIDDVDVSEKIFSAKFIDDNTVEFVTTSAVDADNIQILENGQPFEIETVYTGGTKRRLDVLNPLDLTKVYEIEINFGDYTKTLRIDLAGLYTSDAFNDAYYYDGDLGAIYSATETTFKVWAPTQDEITLNLYTLGHDASITDNEGTVGVDLPFESYEMVKGDKGVFSYTVTGDLHNTYYTYEISGVEIVDPYAKAVGVNGDRGLVVNFDVTDPIGWDVDTSPTLEDAVDSILYELHIRDFTTDETWNGPEELRGTYLGLAETGTTYEGYATGIDHLKELGITTVHFLPIFDYAIVDETRLNDETYYSVNDGIFNWGYMPENFNAVEGSYSTNPYDGLVRINELKQLVQALHESGIRVVMDVVYNHTGYSADSKFNILFPGYYHRMDGESFSNGSGTGNETASERDMVRKYFVDSVVFWATEYHIDGFRFDLMALHDIETMNAIREALDEVDPSIIIYGEPWTGGTSMLSGNLQVTKDTITSTEGIAIFNDQTRDGIKGSVFDETGIGFVQGSNVDDNDIMIGIVAGTNHDAIDLFADFTVSPDQIINYVTAHDNNTLYDKLKLSTSVTEAELINMDKQANAIILTSQGTPFLHAGVELLRTKPCIDGECDTNFLYDHNSYRSPDETNQIDWTWKVDNIDVYEYYQGLIALRAEHPAFRMETADEINESLFFISEKTGGLVSYILTNHANDDEWNNIMVIHNVDAGTEVDLFGLEWNVVVNQDIAGTDVIETISSLTLKQNETVVLFTNDALPTDLIYEDGFIQTEAELAEEVVTDDTTVDSTDTDVTVESVEETEAFDFGYLPQIQLVAVGIGGVLIAYMVGKKYKK